MKPLLQTCLKVLVMTLPAPFSVFWLISPCLSVTSTHAELDREGGGWQFHQVATLSMLPVVGLPKPA